MWSRSEIIPGCVSGAIPAVPASVRLRPDSRHPRTYPSQPKWAAASSGDLATTGTFRPRPMASSDLSQRHTLFSDRVIPGSCGTLLERQPVETGSIEPVDRGPAVEPVADKRRDTLLASDGDQVRNEALLNCVVDLREAHDRGTDALRDERLRRMF